MQISNKHRKKRNVGLLWEFLVRDVTRSIVEGETSKGEVALGILKKYFRPGTEIFKEFLLFKALTQSTLSESVSASNLISEARRVCRTHNLETLESEKTAMIHEINKAALQEGFWDQQVENYKLYATVQTLINDWRVGDSTVLERMSQFENQISQHLISEKPEIIVESATEPSGVEQLAVRLMTKKLNEKWSSLLSDDQKKILRLHIFTEGKSKELTEIFKKLIAETTGLIEKKLATKTIDSYNMPPLKEARNRIISEKIEIVDDDCVSRFMSIVKLRDELKEE